jgi:hypothetical protein
MQLSASIIVSALILGASYIVANRFTATPVDSHDPKLQVLWVIDRVTGKVTRCEGSPKVMCVEEDLHFRP